MAAKKPKLKDLITSEKPEPLIEKLSFEDGLELLEELVDQVEGGALDLDTALVSYERGSMVVGKLRELLSGAEKKLEVLSGGQKD